MNISFEKFTEGMEYCAKVLPGILSGWNKFDYELQEEYAQQIQWSIDKAKELIADNKIDNQLIKRIKKALAKIKAHHLKLKELCIES